MFLSFLLFNCIFFSASVRQHHGVCILLRCQRHITRPCVPASKNISRYSSWPLDGVRHLRTLQANFYDRDWVIYGFFCRLSPPASLQGSLSDHWHKLLIATPLLNVLLNRRLQKRHSHRIGFAFFLFFFLSRLRNTKNIQTICNCWGWRGLTLAATAENSQLPRPC